MKELHHYQGVYAATVCPMDETGKYIDEASLIAHLRQVSQVAGIRGLLINGHAGENFALSREEKRRVVTLARQVCPPDTLLVAGLNAEDSYDAQAQADDAKAAGADAILLFPPYSWTLSTDDKTVLNHHRIANQNAALPMMLYQSGVNSGGMAYPPSLLQQLVCLPNVVAVKEGSWETATYEANLRLVREVAPHVAVMASGDEHLLTCFALGTDGSLVSLAAVVPELVVALYNAMQAQNLAEAQRLHQFVYPLAKEIYGTWPGTHANARLKACLHLAGHLPHAMPRPPVPAVDDAQRQRLATALAFAQSFTANS
ncbi:MAG: dihydrodipicolinate synthase family protein [Pantoea sp.]|uniref:dihydrodipicolinate synthase family protein n=1 Tax=unclassified Pantoea TaxID=2630326 RepID=UPI00239ABB20|nr:dihydrodipicolinate synthase family protein [Pantoea sp.]MDE1189155.1 dihydrodipicolinate synthase family protein [Pantoea sp.]